MVQELSGNAHADEAPAIQTFWGWFVTHSDALRAIATHDDELLNALLAQLHAIHPGLFFEIQVEREPLELVVTAEGRRELFPLIERIVLAAPALPAWRYVALKPAQGFEFTSEFEGVRVEPTQLWFLPLANASAPEKLGIRVGWPELQPEQHDLTLTALLKALDTAIGERCLATEIHQVQLEALPDEPQRRGYLPLPRLLEFLAWHRRRGEAVESHSSDDPSIKQGSDPNLENPCGRRSEPREPNPSSFELSTGHFLVGAPPLRIGLELTRADFCASSLFAAATDFVVAEPEHSWKLAQLVLCGQSFTTILRFRGEYLQRVELMHDDPRYGSSWNDWTPALEMERKAQHEAWLGQLFGAQREFPWGSIAEVQDPHYGTFAIVLRYRRA